VLVDVFNVKFIGFEVSVSSEILANVTMICLVVQESKSSVAVGDACDQSNSALSKTGTFVLQDLIPGAEYVVHATIVTKFTTVTTQEGTVVILPFQPPRCISVVGNDPNNRDNVFGIGDTITIIFDRPTNGTSTLTATELESFVSFSEPIGTDATASNGVERGYEAAWSADQAQLVITVSNPGSALPMVGVLRVDVDGRALNVRDADGTSDHVLGQCPYLSGGFGGRAPTIQSLNEDTAITLVDPRSFAQVAIDNPTEEYTVEFIVRDELSTQISHDWSSSSDAVTKYTLPSPYPILDFVGTIIIDARLKVISTSEVVQSHIIVVQINPVNDAPRISLPRNQLIWANGLYQTIFATRTSGERVDIVFDPDDKKVSVSVQIYDDDVYLRPADSDDCYDYNTLMCSDPTNGSFYQAQCPILCSISEEVKRVTFQGTHNQINKQLMNLQISVHLLSNVAVYIIAQDASNDETFEEFQIKPVCDPVALPEIATATFMESLYGIVIVFDRAVYFAPKTGAAAVSAPTCETMFDALTVKRLGEGAKCVISKYNENTRGANFEVLIGFTEISVAFGAFSSLQPRNTIRTSVQTELLRCSGSSTGVLSKLVTLPPVERLHPPSVRLRTKTPVAGLCDPISISASVFGAGPWAVTYNWTESTKVLFDSIDESLSDVYLPAPGSTANPKDEWLEKKAQYIVCVQITGQFTGLQSTIECVNVSTNVDPLARMMAPAVPASVLASCYDHAFSLSLPHAACRNPTAALAYSWMLHGADTGILSAGILTGAWSSITGARLSVQMDDLRIADGGLREKYTIMLNVSVLGETNMVSSLAIPLQINCDPSIVVMGGTEQMLSRTRPVKLISVLHDDLVHSSEATYQWSCLQNSEACYAVNFKLLPMSSGSDLEIPAGMIGLGAYTFTVCANEIISRTACTTVDVRVVPDCLDLELQVIARGQPADEIAEYWALSFNANIIGVDNNELEFEWDLGQFSTLNGNCENGDCPLTEKNIYLPNTLDDPIFNAGTTLKISVSVKHNSANYEGGKTMTGYAAAEIYVPPGPSGGLVFMLAKKVGGVREIGTSGWGGGGTNIKFHCFYVPGDIGPNHDPDDRVYLTIQPSVIPLFASEYLPGGWITVGVKATNDYGSGYAYTVLKNPENPELADQFFGAKDELLAEAAKTGNVIPSFQLFSAYTATLASGASDSRQRRQRDTASNNLLDAEAMLVSSMQFNVDYVGAMGYAGSVQSQFQTLRTVLQTFTEIAESTQTAAFTTSSTLIADLFDNERAPVIDLALAQRAVDVLVPLEHILLVMPLIGDTDEDLNVQFDYAETIINLLMGTAKALVGGPDAPTVDGTIIPINNEQMHPYLWLSVARVENGEFEGGMFSATNPKVANDIGLLTLNEGCPLMDALRAPSKNGELLVPASMLAAFDSYENSGGIVTSNPTTVRLDLELTPSNAKNRKLLCARLLDGVWTTDGIETAVDSSNLAVGCVLPSHRPAGPTIFCVFEDLSIAPEYNNDDDGVVFIVVDGNEGDDAGVTTVLPEEDEEQPDIKMEAVTTYAITWWVFVTVAATAVAVALSIVVMTKRCSKKRKLENAEAYSATKLMAMPSVQTRKISAAPITSTPKDWAMPERPVVSDSPFDLVTSDNRPSTEKSMSRPSKAWVSMPERPGVFEDPFNTEDVPVSRRRNRETTTTSSSPSLKKGVPNTKGWSDFASPGGSTSTNSAEQDQLISRNSNVTPLKSQGWAPNSRIDVTGDPFANSDASDQVMSIEMDNLHNNARIERNLKLARRQSNKVLQQKLNFAKQNRVMNGEGLPPP